MKKILALTLALVLICGTVLVLTSCGKDEDTSTTVAETPLDVTTQAETTSAITGEITTVAGVTTAAGVTTVPGATTAPATTLVNVAAPVNGDKAAIVQYYNTAANATKAYKGNMKVKRVQGTTSTLEEVSIEAVRGTAEDMLPNDYPKEKNVTFANGVGTDGTKAAGFFPVDDQAYASKLDPSGVTSATCTADGTGYKVVIKLVSESGNDINFVPKHHGSCIDTLNLTAEDLEPFTLNEAAVTYQGATITAKVDATGRITSWDIKEPVLIQGKLAWKMFNLIEAKVIGTWKQQFTITY